MTDIHVYGSVPDQEVLTAWMVASDLPSVVIGATIIGNVQSDTLHRLLPTITGAACTTELPALAHLPHRLVADGDCRQLHRETYHQGRP